ncbi:MAG: tautomerase family protein [Bacillota bacterium]
MPIINVHLWEGRTVEQKRQLAAKFTEVIVEVGAVPVDSVIVTFSDYAKSDWAEGGYLASDKLRISK